MEPQNDLDALALKYGSDKFGGHYYTPHYHQHFKDLRGSSVHLLEIGIGGYADIDTGGNSLRMWRDYFPTGQIYGLDYYDKSGVAGHRIATYQGSQSDPRVITRLLADTPAQQFDIIVDDASHRPELTIASFLMLFQFVADGGWYVVEDTETDFYSGYGGTPTEPATRLAVSSFFKQFIDGLTWRERERSRPEYVPSEFDLTIRSLYFYHNMIFIKKGANL